MLEEIVEGDGKLRENIVAHPVLVFRALGRIGRTIDIHRVASGKQTRCDEEQEATEAFNWALTWKAACQNLCSCEL